MYAEAEPNVFDLATKAVLKYVLEQKRQMATTPLASWAAQRGMDFALSVQWLIEHPEVSSGHEQELWDLLDMTYEQTSQWELWFETFTGNAGPHGVNNAQALKSASVWYRQTGNSSFADLALRV